MADTQVDVLVVGAGPTGLTLAAQLLAHGVRPRIVDRGLDRAHESRALAIQPRTLEVLAGLGVTDELVRLGNQNVRLVLHARGRARSVPVFDLGLADTAYPYLLFLSQAETERVLVDHLARRDVAVDRGVELVDLSSDADAVVCRLRHRDGREERVEAGYVVGCDGAHSTTRELSGIPFEGGSYPQTFVLADVEADGLTSGTAHVFLSERGMMLFFPLVTPASWRLLVIRARHDTTDGAAPLTLGEVQSLADAYTGGAVRLRDPVWMTNFRLHHRAAARYREGRVFLAGDAAHIHSPAGGQGMNTGIQDSVNLAWKLAHVRHGADPALLDTYETERAPIGRMVLRLSDRAFTVATAANPLVAFARTRLVPVLLPLASRAARGRAYVFRTLAELGIRYRRSPLSIDGPGAPSRGPRAGDRLPDGPIVHDGVSTTRHATIAAPGWHLLLRAPDDQLRRDLERPGLLTVHRLPPDSGAAVLLVRPDGHIGYRSGTAGAEGLINYLHRWLPHSPM